ncbi:hypothetical protein EZJ19_08385 [Parasulfuritortus cantonensis]|uniref:Thymidylate kinase-like domain-containing protein n=1 Tax=Parasulfuritortus cantonensis TaxID=2528202 RepID=A0A4R1BCW3_9PROT|nr:AAA family ATPase [Parasulfuritortus cantonensis]TCJ14896.1 hypothetical protein EZJ19_08385 [Parasulfuritortus cantonensis]
MMNRLDERPVFIVFEGLDGAGKSSAAKRTACLLGAHYMTTPTQAVRIYRDEIIGSLKGNQEAAQLFYLATVMAASADVRALLASGQSVVLDRYFLSTQVYAEFRGSTLDVDDAVGKLLLPADLTVFLDAPWAVRQDRVLGRGCSAADRETLSAFAHSQLLSGYERRANHQVTGRLVRIDSSIATIDEIASMVVAHAMQLE